MAYSASAYCAYMLSLRVHVAIHLLCRIISIIASSHRVVDSLYRFLQRALIGSSSFNSRAWRAIESCIIWRANHHRRNLAIGRAAAGRQCRSARRLAAARHPALISQNNEADGSARAGVEMTTGIDGIIGEPSCCRASGMHHVMLKGVGWAAWLS